MTVSEIVRVCASLCSKKKTTTGSEEKKKRQEGSQFVEPLRLFLFS